MTSPKSSADPVGAAMTRDEIIEQCARRLETQKSGSQVYNDICQELASDLRSFKSQSAPPVQAITEAMAPFKDWLDGVRKVEQPGDINYSTLDADGCRITRVLSVSSVERLEAALEAAFRLRLAPSDDAQRPTEAAISAVAEMLKRAAPVPELLKKIEQLEALAGGGADHLLASTLAEFKEACAKLGDAEAKKWRDHIAECNRNGDDPGCGYVLEDQALEFAAALRALPIPEQWRPIDDKIPPGHETLLFLCSNGDVYQGRMCYGMHEPWFCGHSELNFGVVLKDKGLIVTHWRRPLPLPAPPAKEPTK